MSNHELTTYEILDLTYKKGKLYQVQIEKRFQYLMKRAIKLELPQDYYVIV